MAKSTLRLDKRRPLKDGTYPIQIVVGHNTDLYIGTGISAAPEEWDPYTLMYVGKNARRVNSALVAMLTSVRNRILELKEIGMWNKLTRPQIREMLLDVDLEKPSEQIPTLAEVFEKMMIDRRDNTKAIVRSTILKLNAYCGDVSKIHFSDISRTWLEDFYMSMSDLSVNTKSTYMRMLRRAFNWALDRDLTTNNPFRSYHIPSEETRMRDLPIEKMRQLMALDLPGMYKEYRDIYLLTFYLIGINTVDLSRLTPESLVDGRIEYRRSKTNKIYSIKVEPEAMEIINRYRGKKHLISIFDRYKDYKALQGSVNNALAKMGLPDVDADGKIKKAGNGRVIMKPLQKGLSLYWARYSWATYAADLDIPKDTISESLGHSHGAKVTGVYIKFSRDKIDAANRKVIDYVLNIKGSGV